MNMRALVLHVIGDALGNVGVIATGLIIWFTDWKYKAFCDPTISLLIAVIIFSSALPLGTSIPIHPSINFWNLTLLFSSKKCIVYPPTGCATYRIA